MTLCGGKCKVFVIFRQVVRVVTTETDYTVLRVGMVTVIFSANLVIAFFLNNQPDALIIPNLFCYKTLHVSGIFCAHHQEFSTVHSALASFLMTASKQS
jgi:uncharacterized membrane protein